MNARPDERLTRARAAGVGQPEQFVRMVEGLPDGPAWFDLLLSCADPMDAAIQWTRLYEVCPRLLEHFSVQENSSSTDAKTVAMSADVVCQRVNAVFSLSRALGDYLIAVPERITSLWVSPPTFSCEPSPSFLVEDFDEEAFRDWVRSMLTSVRPSDSVDDGGAVGEVSPAALVQSLRAQYRQLVLRIVADDAMAKDPAAFVPYVGIQMSVVVDETLAEALHIARLIHPESADAVMSVIAMGKTGAQELNYISDVDVVYVAQTEDDVPPATILASEIARILSAVYPGVAEEPLWVLDTALRPEGKDGALVRTLDSYVAYWEKWAQTWEFQALLKARPCAGDSALGRDFVNIAAQYVWTASSREGFVNNARSMRQRVEKSVSAKDAQRELKLGRGGLRDVEFSVQLLQLVHGRHDESLRRPHTLAALDALCAGGYVGRDDAAELSAHYCFLRALEHRAQLLRMRRTHLLPTQAHHLRGIARAVGLENENELEQRLRITRERVRALHEEMFYRPIVAAIAGLGSDTVHLTQSPVLEQAGMGEEAVHARLRAIGYVDTRGALGHIRALTAGTSRRAQIQRLLLPVFLDWLAHGIDPDQGLLHFRTLSDRIGDTHWYLGLLRDSRAAARRLIHALSSSRWIATSLEIRPEAVQWLDDDAALEPIAPERLRHEIEALVDRRPDPEEAALRVRAVHARELTRAAMSDSVFGVAAVRRALSQATDASLNGALAIAQRADQHEHGYLVDIAYIAMGRYGGEESSYASDADVIAVHRPAPGADATQAAHAATRIVTHVQRLLGKTAAHAGISVDMDLRPEGKNGPMTKTLEGYREYYERWALTWERQALLRARFSAGDESIGRDFMSIIDPLRYQRPLTEKELQDIRLLKARMGRERLPRGIEAQRHVKLGPGGLSDVEWVIQILQMRHAHNHPMLRTTSTIAALEASRDAGLLSPDDAHALMAAWELASRIRAGNVLVTGRMSGQKLDVLGRNYREFAPLARVLGYARGREDDIEQDWLRVSRQARGVMDRVFWE